MFVAMLRPTLGCLAELAEPRSDIYKVPLQIYDMATLAEGRCKRGILVRLFRYSFAGCIVY